MDKDKQVITDLQEKKEYVNYPHRTLQNIHCGDTKYFVIYKKTNLHLNLNKHEQAIQDSCLFNITISELMLFPHTNFSEKIHGGYILSLLDQVAFASASKFLGIIVSQPPWIHPESYRSRRTSNNESQCKLCWK
jgi:hypothetical protein